MGKFFKFLAWLCVAVGVGSVLIVVICIFVFKSTSSSNWEHRKETDKVTDKVNESVLYFVTDDKYVFINCFDFVFIQKDKNRLDNEYAGKSIIRINDNKPVTYNTTSDNLVTEIYGVDKQLNEMKQGDELIIRLYDKNKSYEDFKIKLKGFAEAYEKLQKSCSK